jgi:hypothetical protein
MTTVAIRKKLHQFIADADDTKVKELYLQMDGEIAIKPSFNCTPKHLVILEEEKRKHLNGLSESYTWNEVKEIIRGTKIMD